MKKEKFFNVEKKSNSKGSFKDYDFSFKETGKTILGLGAAVIGLSAISKIADEL